MPPKNFIYHNRYPSNIAAQLCVFGTAIPCSVNNCCIIAIAMCRSECVTKL